MIVDFFMFDSEFDMLECRMYELDGVVDRFVAVESDHSFSGIEKPYHLSEAMRAGRYEGRPLWVVNASTGDFSEIDDDYLYESAPWAYTKTADAWRREIKQRDSVRPILDDLPDDTIVLYGDLDEIPRRDAVATFDRPRSVLRMDHFLYTTRLRHPNPWYGTVIGRLGEMGRVPSINRATRASGHEWFFRGGWHLSWFGDPVSRIQKLRHSAHQEWSSVGDDIATEYPMKRLHLNGTELMDWDIADAPRWVLDGHAPASWTATPAREGT